MKTCMFCGATIGGDLEETVTKLLNCNNCKFDIIQKGQWTGDGWYILLDLVKRFGIQKVDNLFQKKLDTNTKENLKALANDIVKEKNF